MTVSVLVLEGVRKTFDQRVVLDGGSLAVAAGEVVAVVGPSGVGKSTTLNIAGLLDRPDGGRVVVDGTDATVLGDDERARLRCSSIGMVFQHHHLLPRRSALDNVMLGARYASPDLRAARAMALEALARVGMASAAGQPAGTLSRGEAQRVAFGRALMRSPRLLLCDETTASLDDGSRDRVLQIVVDVASSGAAVLLASHDPAVASVATRVLTLVNGRLAATASLSGST